MPSRRSRATSCRSGGVLCLLLPGLFVLACGGCVATASRDAPLNLDDLTGKSRAWFAEHWGKPRAKSKRLFGGETWVYFRIDGGRRAGLFVDRAPYECQMHLTFDREGVLEAAALSGC